MNLTDRPRSASGGLPRRAVLLVNTGSPARPEIPEVRHYLTEFLSDPLVIQLPRGVRWLQPALARRIARKRAPHSVQKYRRIWTERGSPLRVILEDQAKALEAALPAPWQVFIGMRYGQPSIAAALAEIRAGGFEELVVVPMYPQFSETTTGTVAAELYHSLERLAGDLQVATRTTWYDDGGYLDAQARLIAHFATSQGLAPADTFLLFSAHGLPVSYVRRGDPYQRHVQRTIALVAQRLGWPAERMATAYQSRMGPGEWLQPATSERLAELARAGERRVLVCPISFTTDCLETLEELGLRARADFEAAGGELHISPALNTYEPFIAALRGLVLRGPQRIASWPAASPALLAPRGRERSAEGDHDHGSLVMIGVALRGPLGPGAGPALEYVQPGELARVKRSHAEVENLLREVRAEGLASEALVWNTCHRLELYGWLETPAEQSARPCLVDLIRSRLLGDEGDRPEVNILLGAEAWQHLLRSLAGLDSGLPGDGEVLEQFGTALRLAERAGAAGPRGQSLFEQMSALVSELRAETSWGRFTPSYCSAALEQLVERSDLDLAAARHLVIGGSTTSRSILKTLFERCGVSPRQAALVYRNHGGGQIKLLRKAIRQGRRIKVESYSERAVRAAIAEADVVFFGIDRDTPVLSAGDLRGLRDFEARPLVIVDFNTLGSTCGLESLAGVRVFGARDLEREVGAFAERLCGGEDFRAALKEAEAWIARQGPGELRSCLMLPCKADGHLPRERCTNCSARAAAALAGGGGR